MAATHGFTVPFQDCLAVDLETVVSYLHFVIINYQECICCGTQRSTVEGVQQHMVAKGHCRFDISPDTEDFYQVPRAKSVAVEQMQLDGSTEVRLPSGKIVSHRKIIEAQEPRAPRQETPDHQQSAFVLGSKDPSSTTGLEVAQRPRAGRSGEVVRSSEALVAMQLSKLRMASDREQIKVEQRKRGRLERATNSIMLKHYRLDSGDSRIGRQF
jgi:pre-60S factor REI1